MQRSLDIKFNKLNDNDIEKTTTFDYLGEVFNNFGGENEALTYLFKSLETKRTLLGDRHILIADTYSQIGKTYKILG